MGFLKVRGGGLGVFAFFFLCLVALGFGGAPTGYYASAEGQTGTTLRSALTSIISSGHSALSYDTARDAMFETIDDANNDNMIQGAYSGTIANIECRTGCVLTANSAGFDTEHSWPQSQFNSNLPMQSDLHHIFPSLMCVNGDRGSLPFNEPTSGINEGCVPDGSFAGTLDGSTVYEVRLADRGNTARAMMYMIVRYWNSNAFDPGFGPQDVTQAQIDLYLKWHGEDPPDAREQTRNDRIYSAQGNRNPFIDRPEFAAQIWGGATPTPTPTATPTGTPTPTPTPPPGGGTPWINEIHYDNEGIDADEGIEVAGPAGTDLAGWQLVAYNSSNHIVYLTIDLSGVLPDQSNGFGTIWFPFATLQNGSPDAVVLLNGSTVVQFLSYEGEYTAVGGPADGLTSIDIGVEESSTTLVGESLQLTGGCGSAYADFSWASPMAHTRGLPNTGQTFCATPTPTPSPNAARHWRQYR